VNLVFLSRRFENAVGILLGGVSFSDRVWPDTSRRQQDWPVSPTDMVITKEETFGLVAPLYRFKREEDAVKMVNDTEFGLASYSTAATSAASGESPRRSNTASSASTNASSRPRSPRSAA